MKRGLPIFLSVAILLSACSDREGAVAGGSLLGSVLGAAVGEVIGGSNGSEIGSIVGGIAGGAIGASTVQRKPRRGRYAFIGEGDAGNPYGPLTNRPRRPYRSFRGGVYLFRVDCHRGKERANGRFRCGSDTCTQATFALDHGYLQ